MYSTPPPSRQDLAENSGASFLYCRSIGNYIYLLINKTGFALLSRKQGGKRPWHKTACF
uniref:Uncharacterized protein n=1 Tax=Octopus bimaculoides TaxID=37653 RepID=A0A0L8GWS4_OCTBM